MKSIKEMLLDDSPKAAKKLEKLLAKDTESASYLDAVKAEAGGSGAVEFPKLRMLVTDSFVCYLGLGIGGGLMIVPISSIRNLYRTNIIRYEYDYAYFTLAVETDSGIKYLMRYPRNGKAMDIFNEVIAAVKERMAVNGGTEA